MIDRIDTASVLSRVDIVDVIDRYVPLKKSGAEYEACCPFHTEKSPSFKVSPAKQIYHCFGCGANGDAIGFLMQHQGMTFRDAVEALGGSSALPEAGVSPAPAPARVREDGRTQWVPMSPAPENAPAAPVAHIKRGRPQTVWTYRAASGAVLGYVYRFVTSDGGKEVLPMVWARHAETGASEWRWMAFSEPRPIYGLDRLAARPEAPVLLVEGEKCADAADAELPDLVVVSWPGGGKAVKKVDWSPLAGRKVILWPDADAKRVRLSRDEEAAGVDQASKPLLPEDEQPGHKAMADIAAQLAGLDCRLWSVAVPAAGEKPDGWDVADAIADGLTGDALADWLRSKSQPLNLAPAQADVGEEGDHRLAPDAGLAGAGVGLMGSDESWRALLARKDDKLIDCRENVYLMLKHHPAFAGVLWVDEFARKIVKRMPAPWDDPRTFKPGTEWQENEHLQLGMWTMQNERLLVRAAENLSASINWAATESLWHPVRDYLDGLQWDGQKRIDEWLTDFLGVKRTEYTALVGRFFLIGMVARIYQPGCAMRAMPILEGEQFRGKSTALRILGGDWFGDTPIDLNNKDAYQLIQGRWLYEIAELDAFNRAETTRIKSFISSPQDRFRAPYDRAPRDWMRQTVFAGTTNQHEYFKDTTGNTRYWPLMTDDAEEINLEGLAACRDALFAEAVAAFKAGDRWHPTRTEQRDLFEPEQADREIVDPWESMIYKHLKGGIFLKITTEEILEDVMNVERSKIDGTRSMATRVGNAMKRLGWIKKRATDGTRGYFYVRPSNWEVQKSGGEDAPF